MIVYWELTCLIGCLLWSWVEGSGCSLWGQGHKRHVWSESHDHNNSVELITSFQWYFVRDTEVELCSGFLLEITQPFGNMQVNLGRAVSLQFLQPFQKSPAHYWCIWFATCEVANTVFSYTFYLFKYVISLICVMNNMH